MQGSPAPRFLREVCGEAIRRAVVGVVLAIQRYSVICHCQLIHFQSCAYRLSQCHLFTLAVLIAQQVVRLSPTETAGLGHRLLLISLAVDNASTSALERDVLGYINAGSLLLDLPRHGYLSLVTATLDPRRPRPVALRLFPREIVHICRDGFTSF